MIVVRYIPWKCMVLPTPFLVILVLTIPAPFIILFEFIKSLYKKYLNARCAVLFKQNPSRVFFLYTKRPDSYDLLKQEVIAHLSVEAVELDQQRIADKQLRMLESLLPKTLGNTFPLLVRKQGNEISVESLHHCVYQDGLCLREAQQIIELCHAQIEGRAREEQES